MRRPHKYKGGVGGALLFRDFIDAVLDHDSQLELDILLTPLTSIPGSLGGITVHIRRGLISLGPWLDILEPSTKKTGLQNDFMEAYNNQGELAGRSGSLHLCRVSDFLIFAFRYGHAIIGTRGIGLNGVAAELVVGLAQHLHRRFPSMLVEAKSLPTLVGPSGKRRTGEKNFIRHAHAIKLQGRVNVLSQAVKHENLAGGLLCNQNS